MNLKQKRDAALKDARDIAAKAKTDGRELTDVECKEIDEKLAIADDLELQIKAADASQARLKRLGALDDSIDVDKDVHDENTKAKSLGDHFVKSVGEQMAHAMESGKSRFSFAAPEFKAAADSQLSPAALQVVTTDIDTTIVTAPRRRLSVADVLGVGQISGNALTYFVEGILEGDFTTVAEGSQKPQLHYGDPTAVTEGLKKIAAFIKESDEMIEDLPFWASAINGRLLYNLALFEENQLLNGNGTGTNLRGLLQRSGIQTLGVVGDLKAGNADTIFKAITAVNTGSGLDADFVMINPTDYQTFRLNKDGNGQYFGGGYFQGQYGNGGVTEQPPLWGLPTVVTPAIAAGTVLVGNGKQSSAVYRKGGVRVEATNSNENDFTNNKITVRAEERVLLANRVPAALVKVTLGTA